MGAAHEPVAHRARQAEYPRLLLRPAAPRPAGLLRRHGPHAQHRRARRGRDAVRERLHAERDLHAGADQPDDRPVRPQAPHVQQLDAPVLLQPARPAGPDDAAGLDGRQHPPRVGLLRQVAHRADGRPARLAVRAHPGPLLPWRAAVPGRLPLAPEYEAGAAGQERGRGRCGHPRRAYGGLPGRRRRPVLAALPEGAQRGQALHAVLRLPGAAPQVVRPR